MYTRADRKSREIADATYLVHKALNGDDSRPPTREDLATLGLTLWPHTYRVTKDDREAFERLMDWAEEGGRSLLAAALNLPSEQISMLGAARWADQAFPRFIMSHSYAAALMATAVSEDVLDHIRAPYKAFMVDVPEGLLSIVDPVRGGEARIKWILVQEINDGEGRPWQYIAHTDTTMCLWRHGVTTRTLCEPDIPGNVWDGCSFMAPKDERDDRVAALIGRLIVGVCLASIEPSNLRATSKHSVKASPELLRPSDIRTFKLGKPLRIDCRRAVRDYVEGRRGGPPSVRTLVRGHFKTQRHGPGNSLVKVIWREPYERGPADAPILVRPIAVGGQGG